MYKMMDSKIKFYAENENTLLESVKTTILKAYEKSGKANEKYQKKISQLNQTIRNLQSQLKSKEDELNDYKLSSENQISKLNSLVTFKISEIDQLTANEKVLREDLKKNQDELKESRNNLEETRTLLIKSENSLKSKVEECNDEIRNLSLKLENSYKKSKDCKNEADTNKQVTQKLVETKTEETKILKNEIHKEEKLKANLELINSKINTIKANNTTGIENSIHKQNTQETEISKVRKIDYSKPESQPHKEDSVKEIPKEQKSSNSDKISIKTNSTNTPNSVVNTNIALDLGSLAAADDDSTGPGLNESFDSVQNAQSVPLLPKRKNKSSNKYSISLDNQYKKQDANTMNENQKKEFQFFDQIQVSRFLEVERSAFKKNKIKNRIPNIDIAIQNIENQNLEELTQINQSERLLKNKLDLLTFENINKSRNIYQNLERFEDIIQSLQKSKNTCEGSLKKSISENLELKEALAELEIKFRLSKIRKLN